MSRGNPSANGQMIGFQIKIAQSDVERLKELAKTQGKGHTTLAREFIREKLNAA